MSGTEEMPTPSKRDALLDEALDETFPASDPLAFTPRRAGRNDKKAPTTDADRPHGVRNLMNRLKDRLKH